VQASSKRVRQIIRNIRKAEEELSVLPEPEVVVGVAPPKSRYADRLRYYRERQAKRKASEPTNQTRSNWEQIRKDQRQKLFSAREERKANRATLALMLERNQRFLAAE